MKPLLLAAAAIFLLLNTNTVSARDCTEMLFSNPDSSWSQTMESYRDCLLQEWLDSSPYKQLYSNSSLSDNASIIRTHKAEIQNLLSELRSRNITITIVTINQSDVPEDLVSYLMLASNTSILFLANGTSLLAFSKDSESSILAGYLMQHAYGKDSERRIYHALYSLQQKKLLEASSPFIFLLVLILSAIPLAMLLILTPKASMPAKLCSCLASFIFAMTIAPSDLLPLQAPAPAMVPGPAIKTVEAQSGTFHYVTPGGAGSRNGADWANAYGGLPSSLQRGDTYYIADGDYASYTFDDAVSGTQLITIKKATASDHGTNTGWLSSYGDGQAVFTGTVNFLTSYYTFDGNGTHTVPSNNTNDYGFKISLDLYAVGTRGIFLAGTTNDITLKYIHVYNATQAGHCDYEHTDYGGYVSVYAPGAENVKLQNCYIQNSYKDGIIFQSGTNVLVERNYLEGLGQLADCLAGAHGQSLRIWDYSNVVVRWNIFKDNDGQGIIAYANTMSNVRTYGNVLFNAHKDGAAYWGNNGGMWDFYPDTMTNSYTYNNIIANVADEYPSTWNTVAMICNHGTLAGNKVVYNNMFYNIGSSATMVSNSFTPHSHDAYGNCSATPGGTDQQSGITSDYFMTYDEVGLNFDFRLTRATTAGKILTSEAWWSGGADDFFGTLGLDSAVDMYGNTRGADGVWDRGALEYQSGSQPSCSSLGGSCCSQGQACSGTTQAASDCSACCIGGTCSSQYLQPGQYIEAESGTLASPMQAGINSSASEGKYVYTPTSEQGSASYTFQISSPGKYRMEASVLTPYPTPDGHNSFYLGLDSESAQGNDNYTYDTLQTASFAWDNVSLRGPLGNFSWSQYDPMSWDLSLGLHNFTFYGRESNTWLDQIILKRACIHKSDSTCDGCVSQSELSAFISLWYLDSSNPTLKELIEAIGLWKGGGC